MASGWLQSKGLLEVKDESVTSLVSLTETGREYLEKGTPEMRIINALREGKQFTVKDVIQTWGMEPSEVSSAVGALKEAGVVRIVQGGVLELVSGADISAYEFLSGLIKTVVGERTGGTNLFLRSSADRDPGKLPQARQVQRHFPHHRKEEPFLSR